MIKYRKRAALLQTSVVFNYERQSSRLRPEFSKKWKNPVGADSLLLFFPSLSLFCSSCTGFNFPNEADIRLFNLRHREAAIHHADRIESNRIELDRIDRRVINLVSSRIRQGRRDGERVFPRPSLSSLALLIHSSGSRFIGFTFPQSDGCLCLCLIYNAKGGGQGGEEGRRKVGRNESP